MRLFDAHCHLQDARIAAVGPRSSVQPLIQASSVSPSTECLRYVAERSPNWFDTLRSFFVDTPHAAVGEIGLDKGSHGKTIEFTEQVEVFQQQLELAKELSRPVSVHCVRAFGDLLEILKQKGPFPAGVILHSYMGSAEMVPELSNLGSYFSFSGFLTSMKEQKVKKMLKAVPKDRILLETDAPEGLSNFNKESLIPVQEEDMPNEGGKPVSLNHPANIHNVLEFVSMLLEMPKEEVAELSYLNAVRLFSYPGSKVKSED